MTRPVNRPRAGLMLLVWQVPTDRALVGWSPWGYGGYDPSRDDDLQEWLQDILSEPGG